MAPQSGVPLGQLLSLDVERIAMPDLHFPHRESAKPITEIVSPGNSALKWLTVSTVLVCPEEGQTREIGKDNWRRTVVTSIGDNIQADRLIVGETTNPPGNWSSAPPHKHDRYGDGEVAMEEVYVYKLNPQQGFGL